ncbi:membrane hypothetical protein [Candidatus Glomeribacter gigasporarum BEG34]|uniref:Uncharacterized protein n=1 Tax=Candidatus Glomeribacter gigasporarum BEG34 TaxID=1070319 RepID=G2J857_9BURK|nr:DUF6750 family protein [Candidatus Glomeribacter gigasporarum]CCD28954.1 membrane hypothetical protein [Candidatus Glomeribacter gigasporarum BEG34]
MLNARNILMRLHLAALAHAKWIVLATVGALFLLRLSITHPPSALGDLVVMTVFPIILYTVFVRAWYGAERMPVALPFSMMAALLLFLLFPNTADASIGTMMKSLKNDMGDWIDALIYACYGGGIVSTAIGVNNGIKKSKGDQQVTTGSIFGYGLGGPALGMIGYIMSSASESIGGGASHMGKLPGGL